MKQRCLSWNTNTLLTFCVCVWTAPWVRMTAEPWGGKATSPREEASFHPCSYQKISLKILRSGKVELRNWKDVGLPRPREDAPISSPRSRRTTQAATAAAAKVLLKLAGEIDQICSSTVWLGEIYQVCSSTFQVWENDHWSRPSQYFKLRGTRSTSFFSVYQTWVNREETYHATWQSLLVQYFWAWDACYWS